MRGRQVHCNGCTLCCINDSIRILPGDNASLYKTVPHHLYRGELMLDHTPTGECVYLGTSGCTIHDRKPVMCREMDCRNIARQLNKKQAKQYGALRVWNKGELMA